MPSNYPTITAAERHKLIVLGWLYNPRENIWMFAPSDVPFSPDQADHDKAFVTEISIMRRVAADDLNYATTGTAPHQTD